MRHKDNLYRLIGEVVDDKLGSEQVFGEENSVLNQLRRAPGVDRRDVKATVVDYITAGVETVGNSVLFAVAMLAAEPGARRRLQRELDKQQQQQQQHGPYLRACAQECFRLYPTACQIARILEEETEVCGGFVLPRHTVVLCHHRIAARQEENFARAEEFLPERWMAPEGEELARRCDRSLVRRIKTSFMKF